MKLNNVRSFQKFCWRFGLSVLLAGNGCATNDAGNFSKKSYSEVSLNNSTNNLSLPEKNNLNSEPIRTSNGSTTVKQEHKDQIPPTVSGEPYYSQNAGKAGMLFSFSVLPTVLWETLTPLNRFRRSRILRSPEFGLASFVLNISFFRFSEIGFLPLYLFIASVSNAWGPLSK